MGSDCLKIHVDKLLRRIPLKWSPLPLSTPRANHPRAIRQITPPYYGRAHDLSVIAGMGTTSERIFATHMMGGGGMAYIEAICLVCDKKR